MIEKITRYNLRKVDINGVIHTIIYFYHNETPLVKINQINGLLLGMDHIVGKYKLTQIDLFGMNNLSDFSFKTSDD